jgi:hypothetical protein
VIVPINNRINYVPQGQHDFNDFVVLITKPATTAVGKKYDAFRNTREFIRELKYTRDGEIRFGVPFYMDRVQYTMGAALEGLSEREIID